MVPHISYSMKSGNGALAPEAQTGRGDPTLSSTRDYAAWTKVKFLLPLRKKALNSYASKALLPVQALLKCRLPL